MAITLAGCSDHKIDTFEKYCEGLVGIDIQKKYEPFWSAAFSVSYEADAIRDDYAKVLNEKYMRDVVGRTNRMVWRTNATLHLTNPSSFFQLSPTEFIDEWRHGTQLSLSGELKDDADKCRFGTAAQLFDQIQVHTLTSKVGLVLDTDSVTTIVTDRKKRFEWVPD